MRFANLGSGSRGNATLIEGGGVRVLVDCGFSVVELERRLQALEVDPQTLDAVLVTHEHGDHLRGVPVLSRKHPLPVWMSTGTCRASGNETLTDLHLFNCHDGGFRIGDLRIQPFAVPHDAREPSQFVIREGARQLGRRTCSAAKPAVAHWPRCIG